MMPQLMLTLKDQLPKIRGTYLFNEPLASYTTMKIGGPADVLFQPADVDDFIHFWKNKPVDVPVMFLGEGSNMMVRDGGVRGVVVRLGGAGAGVGSGVNDVLVNGHVIEAYAGATSGKVARAAREHSLTGVEFLCGIPGSIGGALKMNAGAYGQETVDCLTSVDVVNEKGDVITLQPAELNFKYRHSDLPEGWAFLKATFTLKEGNKDEIRNRMRDINKNRATSQPLNMPSSGSWFKNPKREDLGIIHAWQAVQKAECQGLQLGQAQVSEKHANFFVNLGGAKAADMEALSEQVEAKIKEKFGIVMHREVRIVGEK